LEKTKGGIEMNEWYKPRGKVWDYYHNKWLWIDDCKELVK